MGSKDIVEKTLESYNDVFADIVNVLLFDGDEVIKENELQPAREKSMYKIDGKVYQQERDIAKFWKNGEIQIAFFGIENQTSVDNDMPLRVISYDGAAYRNQLKAGKKRYPVITLILYFGDKKWEKPKCILDCFEVPERIKAFVSDYKINIFEIPKLTSEKISKFKSDFKIIADYFVHKEKYSGLPDKIKHVDEFLSLMAVLTNDNRFEKEYNKTIINKKGGISMCEVLDLAEKRGEQRGEKRGEKRGAEKVMISVVRKLINDSRMTVNEIAKLLDIPEAKVIELEKM